MKSISRAFALLGLALMTVTPAMAFSKSGYATGSAASDNQVVLCTQGHRSDCLLFTGDGDIDCSTRQYNDQPFYKLAAEVYGDERYDNGKMYYEMISCSRNVVLLCVDVNREDTDFEACSAATYEEY